jgi:hypothetical protein
MPVLARICGLDGVVAQLVERLVRKKISAISLTFPFLDSPGQSPMELSISEIFAWTDRDLKTFNFFHQLGGG